jgi:hypothetical protein
LAPNRAQLIELLSMVDGRDILCYSSDYPHWDTDEPQHIASRLPAESKLSTQGATVAPS